VGDKRRLQSTPVDHPEIQRSTGPPAEHVDAIEPNTVTFAIANPLMIAYVSDQQRGLR